MTIIKSILVIFSLLSNQTIYLKNIEFIVQSKQKIGTQIFASPSKLQIEL